ncbi:MAG: hypothetical protein J0I19_01300 [Alphaproteobacteria bacterium]|nr:hypothetical protein [Alphaproteobacteria bacterium]
MSKGRRHRRQPSGANNPKDRSIVFKPLGFCMYCGTKTGKIGREHIVPLSLRGDLILPLSSCRDCGDITGAFEGICANKNFGSWRRHLNMRSGRRPSPTGPIKLTIENPDGTKVDRYVSLEDYPKVLALPSFPEPGLLTGNIVAPLLYKYHWHKQPESELKEIADRLGGKLIINQEFDMTAFAKLIAKIGYALTVAEVGVENFEPLSLDFILGKQPQVIGGVVGQSRWAPNKPPEHPNFHHVYLKVIPYGGAHYFLGSVHFFCRWMPMVYSSIVGKLAANPNQRFWDWPGLKGLRPDELAALRVQYDKAHAHLRGDSPKARPVH